MSAASKDTELPFIFSDPHFILGFEGNALSSNGKNVSDAETSLDTTVAIVVPAAIRMPALRWQILPTAPCIITWPHPYEKRYFRHEISDLAPVGHLMQVPGRGLEPLRISPPDPKSGASANSATPANCDAHEARCVGRSGQIALVSFLRFLRQIEGCLR
jgi:hypothetical protein